MVKCIHDRRKFEDASVIIKQMSTGSKKREKVIGAVFIHRNSNISPSASNIDVISSSLEVFVLAKECDFGSPAILPSLLPLHLTGHSQ